MAEIIAHRGANREAPENTLAAFEKALDAGVQGIELDVQFSRDGIPLVHHDATIRGDPITDLTAAEARSLKPISSLEEVITFVNGRCRLYVEVKAPGATDTVIHLLAPHAGWCAIHSFDHRIAAVASLSSEIPTGILLVSYLVDTVAAMTATHARDVWQQADFIDPPLVAQVHEAGGRVIAWTVNDPEFARALVRLGVDGICTDMPRELLDGMKRQPDPARLAAPANVVVWSGDPFEPMTRAERVLVKGVKVQRPSRQDELMQRYKAFPVNYRKQP